MSLDILSKRLPDWHLESVNLGPVPTISDFRGKPLLILFFYLGCPGCLSRAVPFANSLAFEYGDKINILGIHTHFEGPDYSDAELLTQMDALYTRFPVYRDAGLATTFHDYQAGGTPHWVLVDAEGLVVKSIFGSSPDRALLWLDYAIKERLDRD